MASQREPMKAVAKVAEEPRRAVLICRSIHTIFLEFGWEEGEANLQFE